MKYYELAYLISPDLSDSEVANIQQKINSLIQGKEGILDSFNEAVKIDLSYLIKKKEQAFLVSLIFHLKPENIKDLEKELKSDNNILRFIIVIKTKEKIKKIREKPLAKKPRQKQKVELKEIEQKLDEILGKQ